MFPKFGEQGLKKMLRDAGIEIDRDQNLYTAGDTMMIDPVDGNQEPR